MDSFLKLKSEFDNLVSKIKIPGSEVSFRLSYVIHFFPFGSRLVDDGATTRRKL